MKRINFNFVGTPEQLKKWQRWLSDIYPLKSLTPKSASSGKAKSSSGRK